MNEVYVVLLACAPNRVCQSSAGSASGPDRPEQAGEGGCLGGREGGRRPQPPRRTKTRRRLTGLERVMTSATVTPSPRSFLATQALVSPTNSPVSARGASRSSASERGGAWPGGRLVGGIQGGRSVTRPATRGARDGSRVMARAYCWGLGLKGWGWGPGLGCKKGTVVSCARAAGSRAAGRGAARAAAAVAAPAPARRATQHPAASAPCSPPTTPAPPAVTRPDRSASDPDPA